MTKQSVHEAVDEFFAEGLISDVVATLQSGKEATAYLCRANPGLGGEYAVAKVYHERDHRNFANDSDYEVGKRLLESHASREARAVARRSSAGRAIQSSMWVDHEFDTMSALHYAGVDVPEPFACTERALLMEYFGHGREAAPQLTHVQLDRYEAEALLARVLWNIETMLREHVIHADLSPFNALYQDARLCIIDLPQCVDPRFHPQARGLLERDVRNMGTYFAKAGVRFDHETWTSELWTRFELGVL
ncbi:MAG: RIO1 family regulatory kinase/ATPase [Dehalococcoidia bacterium]|nr:RIO1 family regulatory kinase/ATPase [Dehalococcoidia bacterium]